MAKQGFLSNYSTTSDLIAAIASKALVPYILKHGPYIPPTCVIVHTLHNIKTCDLQIDHEDKLYCEDNEFQLDILLIGSSLNTTSLSKIFKNKYSNSKQPAIKFNDSNSKLGLLDGLTIEGNKYSYTPPDG